MTLIYDFSPINRIALIFYFLFCCLPAIAILRGLHDDGKEQIEVDGKMIPVKSQPLLKRLQRIAIPGVIFLVFFAFSFYQFVTITIFEVTSHTDRCEQVQGPITNLTANRSDYRDHQLYEVSFEVSDVDFQNLSNNFKPEELEPIRNANHVLIKYGYIQGQLTICQIYETDPTGES